MKTLRLIPVLAILIAMMFVVSCSKDENTPAPLVKITGKVTFKDPAGATANAAGAVVYLATGSVATTTYEQSTIADANGAYSFSNLSANSYFVNSVYKTDNKNVNGRLNGVTFTTLEGAIVTVADIDVTQDLALVSVGQSGTGIGPLVGNYVWDVATSKFLQSTASGVWQIDAAHSMVTFEFPYRGAEGDFNGSFKQINKFVVNFDPANLATSSIDVEVDMSSVDTRTPGGRDNLATVTDNPTFSPATLFTKLGCISGTFGIATDAPITTGAPSQPITTSANRYAKFKSTSIEKYGNGYVAKGNLIFYGVTLPINMMFVRIPDWVDAPISGTSNGRTYSGFEGKFQFSPSADFGIKNSSLNAAIVKIQVSIIGYKLP